MATISNTPRPGYVWDSTDNVWYPIGVGGHSHPDYITQATAISPTTVDAKGDLLVGSAADTISRLAVGADGSSIVADSSTSTGLRWQSNFAAGKQKILNADFNIWQRGTSFTVPGNTDTYTADRFYCWHNASSGGTNTVSRQTFTPGQTDVPNNPNYFMRWTVTTVGTGQGVIDFRQKVEDVSIFAGQTVTFSFYLKSSSASTGSLLAYATQNFGSGGSSAVDTAITLSSTSIGTTWTRYTGTVTLPSITGKTIGTSNFVQYFIRLSSLSNGITYDTANWQVEAGSVATAFQTATGTIQGELAAAQRYYWLLGSGTTGVLGTGFYQSGSRIHCPVVFPNTMRTAPTLVSTSGTNYYNMQTVSDDNFNSLQIATASTQSCYLYNASEVSGTFGNAGTVFTNNASASIAFSAEL